MKEWRKWTSENHIKELPMNNNFVYYGYKWIQTAFPNSTMEFIETDKESSFNSEDSNIVVYHQSKPILKIVNGLNENNLPYYSEIKEHSARCYTNAIRKKIMRAWSKVPTKIIQFMEKTKLKNIENSFIYWKNKTNWKVDSKNKIKNFRYEKDSSLKKVLYLYKLEYIGVYFE